MRPAWLPCMQSHDCHPSVPVLPGSWRAHMGSGRTHRPQDLESLSSACLSGPLPPSAVPRAPLLWEVAFLFFFFSKPFQAPAHRASIPFHPPNPHGSGDLRRQTVNAAKWDHPAFAGEHRSCSTGSSCQRGNICTGTKKSHGSTDASLKRGSQPRHSSLGEGTRSKALPSGSAPCQAAADARSALALLAISSN